jgi:hypothetical protein
MKMLASWIRSRCLRCKLFLLLLLHFPLLLCSSRQYHCLDNIFADVISLGIEPQHTGWRFYRASDGGCKRFYTDEQERSIRSSIGTEPFNNE